MIGLQHDLLQHELACHSIKLAIRFDFITHIFQRTFTLQYSVVGLLDVVDECLLLRTQLLPLFVASQLLRIDCEADAVLLRNRLYYLDSENCCRSSLRAQAEEWSYARKDTGEGTGQVSFVFDHILRNQRIEMCGRKTGCAYALDFVFALFDVEARILEGTIVLQSDINSLIE